MPAYIAERSGPLRTNGKGKELCEQLAIGAMAAQSQPEA